MAAKRSAWALPIQEAAVGSVFATLGAILALSPSTPAQTQQKEPARTASATSGHDLSGVWVEKAGQKSSFLTATQQEPPLTVSGRAQFRAMRAAAEKKPVSGTNTSDPHLYCDPVGMPRIDLTKKPIEIVETGNEVYIFYEEDHSWRQIYMDARALPDGPDPSYLGYSVGKWDGDTLVVDTVGLNDKTWLDDAGHPHSDALHVVERIRRSGPDALQLTVTFEDPQVYSRPWTTAPRMFEQKRGYELTEDYCVAPDSLGARKAAPPARTSAK